MQGVMRWLTVCVMMLVWVTVTAAPAELRCVDPCLDGGAHKFPTLGFSRTFMREDKIIEIYYKAHNGSYIFSVNCHGLHALDYSESNQLPAFSSLFRVNTVVLELCPPPTGRTYKTALAVFNVTLATISPQNGTYLKLVKLPSHPQLSETHFDGLEHLTDLTIDNEVKVDDPQPEKYFLWPLRNLNKLELKIKHPFGDTPLSEEGSELITSLYSRHGLTPRRRAIRSTAVSESTQTSNHRRSTRRQHFQPS